MRFLLLQDVPFSNAVQIALDIARGQKVRLSRGPSKNNLGHRFSFTRVKYKTRAEVKGQAKGRTGYILHV